MRDTILEHRLGRSTAIVTSAKHGQSPLEPQRSDPDRRRSDRRRRERGPRHPDLWAVVQHGVVYTGGKGKIAEHGGADAEDRRVALLVYAPRSVHQGTYSSTVETTQIAPTILRLLGLDPGSLQAVREEGTRVLPGVIRH